MNRNKYIAIPAALILLLTAAAIIFFFRKEENSETRIIFAHSLNGSEASAVERQLQHYQNINRIVSIEIKALDRDELASLLADGETSPHVFTWKGPFAPPENFQAGVWPGWTGDKWFLALNGKILTPVEIENLKDGLTPDDFETLLQTIQDRGITPLSLGNSHRWPLVIWQQHLEEALGPDRMAGLPHLSVEPAARRQLAWDKLRDWKSRGFFLDETWNEGWSSGIRAFASGKAAMALMSSGMTSSLSQKSMDDIIAAPFPRFASGQPWTIGSGQSLVLRTGTAEERECRRLIEYLTSPAVAAILTKESGQPFFGSDEGSAGRNLTSWESLANSPEMREYGEALEKYVTSGGPRPGR